MGAFSLSGTGKRARGRSDEIATLLADQGKEAFGRSGRFFGRGEGLSDEAINYYRGLVERGFASPEDIAALGERAVPGLRDALGRRQGRLDQQMTELGNIPSAGSVIGERERVIRDTMGDITRQEGLELGIADDLRGSLSGDEDAYTKAIQDRIRGAFGGARDRTTGVFGTARQNMKDLYGGLDTQAGSVFDAAISKVRPGSEARAATSARAFAPQMARTQQRLRRAGIDASSPEAASLLGRVEGQRSRAMDDALSGAIAEENRLSLGKFGAQAGFREKGGRADVDLSLDELSQITGLDMGELAGLTDEQRRNLSARAGISREHAAGTLDARRGAFGNMRGVRDVQLNEPLLGRGLVEEDIGRFNTQLDRMNEEELIARGLQEQEFNRGVDLTGRDITTRGAGAAGLERGAGQAFNVGGGQQAFGLEGSQAGNELLKQILQREQSSSGWGTRLLGGVAKSALGALTGGMTGGFGKLGGKIAGKIGGKVLGAATNVAAPRQFGGVFRNPFGR